MSFKKVTCKVVLSKIATQFKFSDTGWHGEAVEYIGEAIKGIGYHTGFERVEDYPVVVKNFRAKIPCEFESLEIVKHDCCPMLLAYDRDNIIKCDRRQKVATYNEIIEYNKIVAQIEVLKDRILNEPMNVFNPDFSNVHAMEAALNNLYNSLVGIGKGNCLGDGYENYKGNWYYIENDFIKTSFAEGEIHLTGNRFQLDSEGYPMIVDTYKYQKAVEWYILYQMLLGDYNHTKLDWREAEARWEDFRQRAANEPKVMGIDELERFTRRWNSIKRTTELTYRA